jgi:hypothetical protein
VATGIDDAQHRSWRVPAIGRGGRRAGQQHQADGEHADQRPKHHSMREEFAIACLF